MSAFWRHYTADVRRRRLGVVLALAAAGGTLLTLFGALRPGLFGLLGLALCGVWALPVRRPAPGLLLEAADRRFRFGGLLVAGAIPGPFQPLLLSRAAARWREPSPAPCRTRLRRVRWHLLALLWLLFLLGVSAWSPPAGGGGPRDPEGGRRAAATLGAARAGEAAAASSRPAAGPQGSPPHKGSLPSPEPPEVGPPAARPLPAVPRAVLPTVDPEGLFREKDRWVLEFLGADEEGTASLAARLRAAARRQASLLELIGVSPAEQALWRAYVSAWAR